MKLLTSLFATFSLLSLNAQDFNWVTAHESSQASDYASDITTDTQGNVYSTGTFQDTVDFDYTAGQAILISNGNDDVFYQKHDANGNLIWAKSFGGTEFDRPTSMHFADDGYIYLSGYYAGAVDFDAGAGTTMNSANGQDSYLLKLDTNGELIWAKFIGGADGQIIKRATTDASGNIILAGHFGGTVDFDPGTGTAYLSTTGWGDCFVVKLDQNGDYIWAKRFGGSNLDWIHEMDTDSDNNILTTGRYQSPNTDFDPGPGTSYSASVENSDVFVHSLDSNGNFNWVSTCNGPGFQEPNAIYVDALNNVYTTGMCQDSMVFDGANNTIYQTASSTDVFFWKIDQNGAHQWSHVIGSTSYDTGYDIAGATNGDIYLCGSYSGTVDFDPTATIDTLSNEGSLFIARYDAAGNLNWKYQNERTSYCAAKAIFVDGNEVYVSGEYSGTIDFNYGPVEDTLSKTGGFDMFLLNLGPVATSDISTNSSVQSFNVYPNPIAEGDMVTIAGSETIQAVQLFDMNGRQFATQLQGTSLFTSDLPSGTYLLKIETTSGSVVKRLVIR